MPAGSLQFVDFHKPDPGAERVQRFMTAAKHALAEGDFKLAAQRLVYARDAEPRNTAVLRLLDARVLAGRATTRPRRAPCATGSARSPSARRRTGRRAHLRGHGRALPGDRRGRARDASCAPGDAVGAGSGSAGCGCARSTARARATRSSARARWAPSEQGLLDLALVAHLMGDVGAEVTACEQATRLAPESARRWARYAHALARTDRVSDCLAACERALELADDPEVRDLRDQVLAAAPRELDQRTAA